jgi:hypothetical protein
VPEVRAVLTEGGFEGRIEENARNAPSESTLRKLEVLHDIQLDERADKFVASLRSRVTGGRGLSEAQVRALDNIVMRHSKRIANFEEIRESLQIQDRPPQDEESGVMLAAMEQVKTWHPPTQRGSMLFDDRAFFESLRSQFRERGFLSPRQRFALRRLLRRYGFREAPAARPPAAGAGAAREDGEGA